MIGTENFEMLLIALHARKGLVHYSFDIWTMHSGGSPFVLMNGTTSNLTTEIFAHSRSSLSFFLPCDQGELWAMQATDANKLKPHQLLLVLVLLYDMIDFPTSATSTTSEAFLRSGS
jgi:hypothetical protein